MVKIQKISEIEPCLGFTEFDMLKKYRQSFATSELGRLHALFPFSELARQMHLKSFPLGRKSYFSPEGKIVWRANLCATFLGNLVYPTPASKMLHFP